MSNLFRNIEEPIFALVDRWIIDYFSRLLWKHFEEQGTVVNEWIDGFMHERQCIQVLETHPGDNLDLLELQSRLLIQFMCRMSGGSFGTAIVNNDLDEGRTELEEAIELLEQIIVIGNHGMSSTDLLRLRISVKQQAVYACCREGNFDLAAKVFFRQWKSWKTREEMEARKNIAEVLDSKNHVHEHLKSLTYEKTLNDCKQLLRNIFNNMAPPFLVTAAKNVWERMKNEDTVEDADAELTNITKVKKEQTDKGELFNKQKDVDMSDSLVNEVCARGGSMLNSTTPVAGVQVLSDSKGPGTYARSETLMTMMRPESKSQTYPLLLWTNSISPSVLSPAVSSASIQISDRAQATASHSFTQQRQQVAGPEPRMYLGLSSNQFAMPEEIYLNTVPVVTSQVYATTPLLQEPSGLVDGGSIQQMWNIPATTIANEDFLSGTTTAMTETEPAVVLKPKRKRGRRRISLDLAQSTESSLQTALVSQPLPLMTEVTETSPKTKQRGRRRSRVKDKSSMQSVTPVPEETTARVRKEETESSLQMALVSQPLPLMTEVTETSPKTKQRGRRPHVKDKSSMQSVTPVPEETTARVRKEETESSLQMALVSQPLPLMTEVTETSPKTKQRGRRPHVKDKSSMQSVTPVLEETAACFTKETVSLPATVAKCPRITRPVSIQPEEKRLCSMNRSQTALDSRRDLAAERIPVVCLTKISNQVLQNLPSSEVCKKSQNFKTKLESTESRHTPTIHVNSNSDYVHKTKRKTRKSSGSPLTEESLPKASRKSELFKYSDNPSSSSESIRNKRKRSSSLAKEKATYSSEFVTEEMSNNFSVHTHPTPKKGRKIKKGNGAKLPWTPDEIDKFYKAVQKYGQHWVMISRYQLLGRSPNDLSNRWRSITNGKELKLLKEKFGPVS